jgi:hypothetical protein
MSPRAAPAGRDPRMLEHEIRSATRRRAGVEHPHDVLAVDRCTDARPRRRSVVSSTFSARTSLMTTREPTRCVARRRAPCRRQSTSRCRTFRRARPGKSLSSGRSAAWIAALAGGASAEHLPAFVAARQVRFDPRARRRLRRRRRRVELRRVGQPVQLAGAPASPQLTKGMSVSASLASAGQTGVIGRRHGSARGLCPRAGRVQLGYQQ